MTSETKLFGLVKHVTYVEGVWYGHAITGDVRRDRHPSHPGRVLPTSRCRHDQIRPAHCCGACGLAQGGRDLDLDDVVTGRRESPIWAIHLNMLRKLTRHRGTQTLLREQSMGCSQLRAKT